MKTILSSVLLFSLAFLINSCSESEDSSKPSSKSSNDKFEGSSSFEVTGDIEEKYTGVGYFGSFERSGNHSWSITLVDQKPMTFTVAFSKISGEKIESPEEGKYKLGINPLDESIYLASFQLLGDNPRKPDNYSVGVNGTSGTLEITKSTEEIIEGKFSFTAVKMERGEVVGNIEVTDGKFSAVSKI